MSPLTRMGCAAGDDGPELRPGQGVGGAVVIGGPVAAARLCCALTVLAPAGRLPVGPGCAASTRPVPGIRPCGAALAAPAGPAGRPDRTACRLWRAGGDGLQSTRRGASRKE